MFREASSGPVLDGYVPDGHCLERGSKRLQQSARIEDFRQFWCVHCIYGLRLLMLAGYGSIESLGPSILAGEWVIARTDLN